MPKKPLILVIEDEEAIRLGLEENLRSAGYEVACAATGAEGLEQVEALHPALVLLDLMMPGKTGYEVCRDIRAKGLTLPVVMVTARGEEFDKLHGFETGADDYVTKPFSINELLARIKAVLSRGQPVSEVKPYSFDDCVLDIDSRILIRKGVEVPLTRTEFDLLAYFCKNAGKALSRNQLMNDVWGTDYYGTQRSLDSFVANLRAKIEKDVQQPKRILTVHGVGYKFKM